MNSKLFDSVSEIYTAFYENPDLVKEPKIAQLFGTINLVGEATALDMIEEIDKKKVLQVVDYQKYADELYRYKLRRAFACVLDNVVLEE